MTPKPKTKRVRPVKCWAISSNVGIIFVAMDKDTCEEVLLPPPYPMHLEKTWKIIPVMVRPIIKRK